MISDRRQLATQQAFRSVKHSCRVYNSNQPFYEWFTFFFPPIEFHFHRASIALMYSRTVSSRFNQWNPVDDFSLSRSKSRAIFGLHFDLAILPFSWNFFLAVAFLPRFELFDAIERLNFFYRGNVPESRDFARPLKNRDRNFFRIWRFFAVFVTFFRSCNHFTFVQRGTWLVDYFVWLHHSHLVGANISRISS